MAAPSALVRIAPPASTGDSAALAAAADDYASAAVPLPRRMAFAWLVACLAIAPLGLFLAWVVLRLGYFKNGATIAASYSSPSSASR